VHRSALALKLLIYEPTGTYSQEIKQLAVLIFFELNRSRRCKPNFQSAGVYWRDTQLVSDMLDAVNLSRLRLHGDRDYRYVHRS